MRLKLDTRFFPMTALAVMLAGCAQLPRPPLVQQPMTARAPAQPAPAVNAAIYRSNFALFEDARPRSVGDILTIIIGENINASKSSAANSSRTSAVNSTLGILPKIMGNLSNAMSASGSGTNTLDAKGGANAGNTFSGIITVTVTEVLGNGNLLVSGEKQMMINQGTEFIRFSGVVNPLTVTGTNTVASTQVADARLEYSAKGYIDEAQNMGWLQRFFLNVLPY